MPFIMMKLVQAVCIFKHAIGLDSLLNILKAPATVEFCSSHTHLRTPHLHCSGNYILFIITTEIEKIKSQQRTMPQLYAAKKRRKSTVPKKKKKKGVML